MHLLHTTKLDLHEFIGSDIPKYAILSHTWGDGEVLFRHVCDKGVSSDDSAGSSKIRNACAQAVKDGWEYIWIDTCCINKQSSAELSEAINSMYKWYQASEVCYVFLADVSPTAKELKGSRWFTRGWTLQELLAPRLVKFYDQHWNYLGCKDLGDKELLNSKSARDWATRPAKRSTEPVPQALSFLMEIAEVTRIGLTYLTEKNTASIAQKMSWLARRQTDRGEDMAYCMLGLFDVNMPLLYGEGEAKAFFRLQLQILKISNDDSILAHNSERSSGLLAHSPRDFAYCEDIQSGAHPYAIARLEYVVVEMNIVALYVRGAMDEIAPADKKFHARTRRGSLFSKYSSPPEGHGYDTRERKKKKRERKVDGETLKPSSSQTENGPALPGSASTYTIPSAVPTTRSHFPETEQSSQPSRKNISSDGGSPAPSLMARRITMYGQWLKEHHSEPPVAIFQNKFSVSSPQYDTLTVSDKAKSYMERYSGQEWDWWPAKPPKRPRKPNKIRLHWNCRCGEQRYADCSPALVRKCVRIGEQAFEEGHGKHDFTEAGAESTNVPDTAPAPAPSTSTGESSQSSDPNALFDTRVPGQDQAGNIIQHGSSRPDLINEYRVTFFILLGIKQSSRVDHTQLETSRSTYNDSCFFKDLRAQYRSVRGFYRYWLSPLVFSHCSFVKYTRFYVNELAHVGLSLPVDPIYVYTPRPPGPHDDPPISPHEFNRRFYTTLCNPCGRSEAVTRIPKRSKRFQTNLHVDGREDMWGLHLELRPSLFRVLLWQIAVTAAGWALMAWWLVHHKTDLQGAAVPVTIIITATAALYVPLWEKMK